MKIAIVLNGISLAKKAFYSDILPALKSNFDLTVFETRTKNDAVNLGSQVVQKKFDLVFAAGGDGTVHQVVNGILRHDIPHTSLPVIGLIPIGSGNDFARCFEPYDNSADLVGMIQQFKTVEIDVGEVSYSVKAQAEGISSIKENRYFVNVADIGMGPVVVRKVLSSGRALGSAFAYYQSILSTFFSYKPNAIKATADTWEWRDKTRTLAVCNGKYYGNGLCIAPDARLNDGRFDVFACGPVSIFDFILQSIPLKQGKYVKHRHVHYKEAGYVELISEHPMEIEADGEILGWLPASVRVSDRKLKILIR